MGRLRAAVLLDPVEKIPGGQMLAVLVVADKPPVVGVIPRPYILGCRVVLGVRADDSAPAVVVVISQCFSLKRAVVPSS